MSSLSIPLESGVLAKASAAPLFRPPGPHPILIIGKSQAGLLKVAWISHSFTPDDQYVVINDQILPSAFRPPYPVTSRISAIIIRSGGRFLIADTRIVDQETLAIDRPGMSSVIISLSKKLKLNDSDWLPVNNEIWILAGWTTRG